MCRELVLLEDQDRSRWKRNEIAEGIRLVETALPHAASRFVPVAQTRSCYERALPLAEN